MSDLHCDGVLDEVMLRHEDLAASIKYIVKTKKFDSVWGGKVNVESPIPAETVEKRANDILADFYDDHNIIPLLKMKAKEK